VAVVPRWEPETVKLIWEPETLNRKGLHMTKLHSPLKNWRYCRRFERAMLIFRNALETQNRCLEALPPIGIVEFGGTSLAHVVVCRSWVIVLVKRQGMSKAVRSRPVKH
jgi:hypothetical protein